MRTLAATIAVLGILLLAWGAGPASSPRDAALLSSAPAPVASFASTWGGRAPAGMHAALGLPEGRSAPDVSTEQLTAVVKQYCTGCHNDALMTGSLSLQAFDVGAAPRTPETSERMIRKLRAGMMPPPGMPRPGADTLVALVETLEKLIDESVAKNPNPGDRVFQRLNRPEYQQSVLELLDLQINAGDFLPLDTKSANFDNIADVQVLSATLLDAYLNAAAEISRLAVGDPKAAPGDKNYEKSGYNSQWAQVEGAP